MISVNKAKREWTAPGLATLCEPLLGRDETMFDVVAVQTSCAPVAFLSSNEAFGNARKTVTMAVGSLR